MVRKMQQVVLHFSPASDAPQRNPFVSFLSHLSLETSFSHRWFLIFSRCTHCAPRRLAGDLLQHV